MGDTLSLKITDKVLYIQYLGRSLHDSTDLFRLKRLIYVICFTQNTRLTGQQLHCRYFDMRICLYLASVQEFLH